MGSDGTLGIRRRTVLRSAGVVGGATVFGGLASAHGGRDDCTLTERTTLTGSVDGGEVATLAYRPRTADPCKVVFDLSAEGTADLDLYVTLDGRPPSANDYDRSSWSTGSDERLVLEDLGSSSSLGVGVRAYSTGGSYRLQVREGGRGSVTPADDSPSVDISFDRRPYRYDERITFESDADADVEEYDWTFEAAGGTYDRTGQSVQFSYDVNGDRDYGDAHNRYRIEHTVTDSEGQTASTTEQFHVLPDSVALYQDQYLTDEFGLDPARVVKNYVDGAFRFLESQLGVPFPDADDYVTVYEEAPLDTRDEHYRKLRNDDEDVERPCEGHDDDDGPERFDGCLLVDMAEWLVNNDRLGDDARHLLFHSDGHVVGPGVTGVPHSAAPADALAQLDPEDPRRFTEKGKPLGEHVQRTMHELGHNLTMGERVGVHYDAEHPQVDWDLPDEGAVYTTPQDNDYDGTPNACGDESVDPSATETVWFFWEEPKYDTHYADAYWWPGCAAANMANQHPDK